MGKGGNEIAAADAAVSTSEKVRARARPVPREDRNARFGHIVERRPSHATARPISPVPSSSPQSSPSKSPAKKMNRNALQGQLYPKPKVPGGAALRPQANKGGRKVRGATPRRSPRDRSTRIHFRHSARPSPSSARRRRPADPPPRARVPPPLADLERPPREQDRRHDVRDDRARARDGGCRRRATATARGADDHPEGSFDAPESPAPERALRDGARRAGGSIDVP